MYHEVSGAMNNLLEQRLWKWKLVAGVLTIVLGAIALPEQFRHHLSLMHGWIPMTMRVMAAVALLVAIARRTRRWRLVWLPWALVAGAALTAAANWYIASEGLAGDDPAPHRLWIWIGLSGVAAAVLLAGWRGARWWWRGVSVSAVPLCLLCAALAVNLWVGYSPTVQTAWNQLTAAPARSDGSGHRRRDAEAGQGPRHGHRGAGQHQRRGVGVRHRDELVYLPPAWFASNPPPGLPTVMMIGGEFNTPADWLRAGNAVKTIDDFAAAHGGNAPVLVFVDSGGGFNNDTECVNGSRGNAADHLTKDVVPFMISHFGVSPDRRQLGCRRLVDGRHLRRRPDRDASPTCSARSRTSPVTSARTPGPRHRPSPDSSAATPTRGRPSTPRRSSAATAPTPGLRAGSPSTGAHFPPRTNTVTADNAANGLGGLAAAGNPNDQTAAANSLCGLGSANGIKCVVVAQPGKHDWPFAARAFAAAPPWLASQLGTPGVPAVAMPGPE